MWTYSIASGIMTDNGGIAGHTFQGYSGAGIGKNNVSLMDVSNVGPIPVGMYSMGTPEMESTHGPFAIPLIPSPLNVMFGRCGFMLHGDSLEYPGCASHGCIIISPRLDRELIYDSGQQIQVVP